MQQVFSELKLINLNTEETNILPVSIAEEMQLDEMQIDEVQIDVMQADENLTTINLDNNEILINELLLQYEDSIQKGIYGDNYIQLIIKQHIIFKSKNEDNIY